MLTKHNSDCISNLAFNKTINDLTREFVNILKKNYNYSSNQIEINPKILAFNNDHIVVYRDKSGTQSFLFISVCNADSIEELTIRAAQYARSIGAEYYIVGEPKNYKIKKINYKNGSDSDAKSIPFWTFSYGWSQPIGKDKPLPPFRDEKDLRKVIREAHNIIFTNLGYDPAATFDEVSKFIIAKIYDENSDYPSYRYYVNRHEDIDAESKRLKELFKESEIWFANSVENIIPSNGIQELDSHLFLLLIDLFKFYSFNETTDAASGTDIKGVIYESMVGSTFRGELGSYFTPRNLADFMVSLLDPQIDDKVFDIANGSAGFLISTIRHLKEKYKYYNEYNIYGTEINPRMVRAAKLNLLINGGNPKNIRLANGLDLEENMKSLIHKSEISICESKTTLLDRIPEGPFDIALANPPFAGFERDPSLLRKFKTAYRNDDTLRSLNKTIPFIEAILASLKDGGKAGIVIPISILNAEEESFVDLRKIIIQNSEIMAIIGLPRTAFYHTDCGIEGALLFLKKMRNPREEYNVFMGWANTVGYDRVGSTIKSNDLLKIVGDYKSKVWADENIIPISDLIKSDRFDPNWWSIKNQKILSRVAINSNKTAQLTEYFEIRREMWSKKLIRNDQEYTFFEVKDTDMNMGTIINVHKIKGEDLRKKNRIRQIVRSGDILLPNHRDSLIAKSADGYGRSVVYVSDEFDGVLTTDRFIVLKPLISPFLLSALLNSKDVRDQLVMHSRGAASLDIRRTVLEKIIVPRINLSDKSQFEVINQIENGFRQEKAFHDKIKKFREDREELLKKIL